MKSNLEMIFWAFSISLLWGHSACAAAQDPELDLCKSKGVQSLECRSKAASLYRNNLKRIFPNMRVSVIDDTIVLADPDAFKREDNREVVRKADMGKVLCVFGFSKVRIETLTDDNTSVDASEFPLDCAGRAQVPNVNAATHNTSPVQSPFVIKGHTLGEGAADFLTREPKVQADIGECRKGKKAPKWTVSGDCDQLLAMAAGGSMVTPPTGILEERLDDRPHYSIASGILIKVRMSFFVGDDNLDEYNKLKSGLIGTYGTPTSETPTQYENAYGASYTGYDATWKLSNAVIHLSFFPGREPYCVIVVETPDAFKQRVSDEKAKGSIDPLK